MNIFSSLWILLKWLWSLLTTIRHLLANLLFLLIIAAVFAAVTSEKKDSLSHNSVLVLDPEGVLVEDLPAPDPAEAFLRGMGSKREKNSETKVQDMIDAIRSAAEDSRIEGIYIAPQDLEGCDLVKLLEIGKAIRAFKESGKPVIAESTLFTQGQYLLASYADSVYVNPLGGVLINGFGAYQTYFKGLLDKARVTFHLFRVGEYKTAAEPLVRESMSEQARSTTKEWLDALWGTYLDEVAKNRELTAADIAGYAENIHLHLNGKGGDASRLAVSAKLADEVLASDQVEEVLAGRIGEDPDHLNYVSFRDYVRVSPPKSDESDEKKYVGIIRARGAIVPGEQTEDMIGSLSVGDLLENAREDDSIAAIVLRLDSPGGSASASEEIHREIIRTREAGKPVVISMGSVAASGAYWIAAAADRVVAAPTTLTGSIGIFAVIPTFENTAKEWGITTDGLGTTPFADMGNPLRPLSPQAGAAIQSILQSGYDMFITRVSEGRKIPPEEVEKSAQGRVFTGQEAFNRKLVDQLGDLDDAIASACDLAGLDSVQVKELRRKLSPREKLMQSLASSEQAFFRHASPSSRLLGLAQDKLKFLDTFADPNHIYVRSLECEAAVF